MSGTLKIDNLSLGDSVTATHNFTLKTNGDGTAVLARGNDGATTQDILTIDANVRVILGAVTAYADDVAVAAGGLGVIYAESEGNQAMTRLKHETGSDICTNKEQQQQQVQNNSTMTLSSNGSSRNMPFKTQVDLAGN